MDQLTSFEPSSMTNAGMPTKAEQEASMFDQFEQNYQRQQPGRGSVVRNNAAAGKQSQRNSHSGDPVPAQSQAAPVLQQSHGRFDEEPLPARGGRKSAPSPRQEAGSAARGSTERTLSQLASDSLDEFYQDEQVKENMATANVGYRGFTTFGNNLAGGGGGGGGVVGGGGNNGNVNFGSTGGSYGSIPSPSGSDTLTSEVRQRGDVKLPTAEGGGQAAQNRSPRQLQRQQQVRIKREGEKVYEKNGGSRKESSARRRNFSLTNNAVDLKMRPFLPRRRGAPTFTTRRSTACGPAMGSRIRIKEEGGGGAGGGGGEEGGEEVEAGADQAATFRSVAMSVILGWVRVLTRRRPVSSSSAAAVRRMKSIHEAGSRRGTE